ncbi:MAG: ABC transporter ATP-binding protein [Acidimicrobiia bacterium]|nr:ABC transporter ATP-binding protein [Acidimicrobiia bacterium]
MGEPQSPAIEFEQVSKRFGSTVAVDQVDLTVDDGEFFTLLGPSGSGKTTCLRMIAGFDRPTSGRVLLHGEDVTRLAPFERDVNTVFQDYALFPHLSVADNVGYGLMVKKVDRVERRQRVAEALTMVRLPVEDYGRRRPNQLSGGQRQRVALARALVNQPAVLLLDEPLGALDLKLRQEMQGELKRIQREVGITFIFVTHDQEEALTLSDRLAVFNNGRIEQVGPPTEVYEHPGSEFVAGFVGSSNLLPGPVSQRLIGDDRIHGVRPEKISLRPESIQEAGAPGVSTSGVVREVEFLGTVIRYRIETDDAELTVIRQNDPRTAADPLTIGQAVVASWPRESMRALSSSEPTGSTQSPRLQERQP